LAGDIEAMPGGHVELFDKRYDIDRARVGFGGGPKINPNLDVRISRQLSLAQVIIEVHGSASKPKVRLSSSPPIYDEAEVIAILISGDPGDKRVSERSMDAKVAGAISGLLVGAIKNQIAPRLPIDVIKVDVGETGYTGLASSRVEVGKYLTDNIYVSYNRLFGQRQIGTRRLNANEGELEYRFKGRFVLVIVGGDAPAGRADLFWTYRF
jgi:translocation and assembly module TamB